MSYEIMGCKWGSWKTRMRWALGFFGGVFWDVKQMVLLECGGDRTFPPSRKDIERDAFQ